MNNTLLKGKIGCSGCYHWREDANASGGNVAVRAGFCNRFPPQMIMIPTPQGVSINPMSPVTPSDFLCGEFKHPTTGIERGFGNAN